jgi:hypothetical protein
MVMVMVAVLKQMCGMMGSSIVLAARCGGGDILWVIEVLAYSVMVGMGSCCQMLLHRRG